MQKQGYLYAVIADSYMVINNQSREEKYAVKSDHQYLIGCCLEIEESVAIVLANESSGLATNFGNVANISPSKGDIFSDIEGHMFTVIAVQEDVMFPFVTVEY